MLPLLLISLACGHQAVASDTYVTEDCGYRYETKRFKPTISHGINTESNEFPWHVALYLKDNNSVKYICGGTIIDPIIIVTAAHCVYDENNNKIYNSDMFVAVGKYHSSWDVRDPNEKRYKVIRKQIKETYIGAANRFADDIALLALNETIEFNSLIMPICVDWSGRFEGSIQNQTGLIAGWGYTEKGTLSEILFTAKLHHFGFTDCRNQISEGYSNYVTSDKFCTKKLELGGVEAGDSGGALTFPIPTGENTQQYYIYGVLSGKDKFKPDLSTFTNITIQMTWLNSTMNNIRAEVSGKKECGIRYELNRFEQTISYGNQTNYNELPWHAAIYRSDNGFFEYTCGGSIINTIMVITTASCVYNEDLDEIDNRDFVVAVGKYHSSWDIQDQYERRYEVIRKKIKETYVGSSNRYADDIAVLALNETIKFNSLIMPICLDWSGRFEGNLQNQIGLLAGWGLTREKRVSEELHIIKLQYLSFTNCRNRINEGYEIYVTSDKFCTKSLDSNKMEPGDGGGALIFPTNTADSSQYFMKGILSGTDRSTIAAFTDINVHMAWLSSTMRIIRAEIVATEECGIRYDSNRFEPTNSYANQTNFNKLPWHVAIYRSTNSSYDFRCVGSIIDPIIVITAAYCVYDEDVNEIDNSDFIVAVGKYHSSWDIRDQYERRYKVIRKKIKKTYFGRRNRYADNIAVLALNETIKFNSLIMPICLDWSGRFEGNLQNQIGLIAGWGMAKEGIVSEELRIVKLRYLSFTNCRNKLANQLSGFLTSDKFCAESIDLANIVEHGDGGGPLIFSIKSANNSSQYFMKGILSGRDRSINSTIAIITDINMHMAWLNSTMRNIQAEIIATKGCGKKYPVSNTDEVGEKEKYNDYPWLATIYNGWEKEIFGVICIGNIIHPRAIITSASCLEDMSLYKPVGYKVVVGKHNLTVENKEPYEQRLNVVNIHKHEGYMDSGDRSENDIAIVVVDDDIKFTKAVVPICIDMDDKLKLYEDHKKLGKIVSWNIIECHCQGESTFKYVTNENCRYEFETPEEYQRFITNEVFCGQFVDGTNFLNSSLTGAGLVYQNDVTTDQRYYLYGIVSKGRPPNGRTTLFTKIKTSLRWISDTLTMIYIPRYT